MTFRSTLLTAVALIGFTGAAHAVPLAAGSQISLNGYVAAIGSTSLAMATGLDFVNGPTGPTSPGVAGTLTSYGAGYGSFAGISCAGGTCGSIQDISNLTVGAQTISNLISLSGGNNSSPITFNLANITEIDRLPSGFLNVIATGIINYSPFDPTAGTFSFSAQGNQIVSFSATTLAVGTPTPEPASLAILGGSLAALGLLRRRAKS